MIYLPLSFGSINTWSRCFQFLPRWEAVLWIWGSTEAVQRNCPTSAIGRLLYFLFFHFYSTFRLHLDLCSSNFQEQKHSSLILLMFSSPRSCEIRIEMRHSWMAGAINLPYHIKSFSMISDIITHDLPSSWYRTNIVRPYRWNGNDHCRAKWGTIPCSSNNCWWAGIS